MWLLWKADCLQPENPGQRIKLLNCTEYGAARHAQAGDILCGPKGILQLYFQVSCLEIWSKGLSPLKGTRSVSVWHHDLCNDKHPPCLKFVLLFPPKLLPVFFFFSVSPDPLSTTEDSDDFVGYRQNLIYTLRLLHHFSLSFCFSVTVNVLILEGNLCCYQVLFHTINLVLCQRRKKIQILWNSYLPRTYCHQE